MAISVNSLLRSPLSLLLLSLPLLVLIPIPQVSADTILVVIEDGLKQEDYSRFWSSLRSRDHEITFRAAKDGQPTLSEFDQPSFQHLVLFAPTTKSFATDLSPQALVQYLEDGGNILLAGSTHLSEFWRDFVREFDLDFDDRATAVIDHFNHLDQPTKIVASVEKTPLIEDELVIPISVRKNTPPVLFRGIGHAIGRNPLLISVLRASPLAYSSEIQSTEVDPNPFIIGDEINLVSAFQTRKQSRIVFVGSVDFFSDEFTKAQVTLPDGKKSPTGNKKVAEYISKWTFQESGVLRIISSTHGRLNGEKEPERYRINDQIEYKVDVQSLQDGRWGPASINDLQLEFTMLDPHLRVTLRPTKSSNKTHTTYSTIFRAPDRHGVFTFKLDYRRRNGYTHLIHQTQVSVTPPEHDQYERFILGAFPYYLGSLSVLGSFVLFCIVWLTHVPGSTKKNR